MVGNLIQNAVQFSPEGGTVNVSLAARGDEWVCRVSDQGPPLRCPTQAARTEAIAD